MVTGRASLFGCLIACSKYARLCGGEYSDTVKFHLKLVYLVKYTIKLLSTEIPAHTYWLWHSRRIDVIPFNPYTLNVRTKISSYGPRARFVTAYYITTGFELWTTEFQNSVRALRMENSGSVALSWYQVKKA